MKCKSLVIAVLAGWVLPWAMYAVAEQFLISKAETQHLEDIAEPSVTETETETEQTGRFVSVLLSDGNTVCMELNDYLTGVVLGEMPASFETEALKAQAVVARTYTLKRQLAAHKHNGGAVCTDSSCCQAYCTEEAYLAAGNTREHLNKVKRAVSDTEYAVLLYDGALIDATYFSCAGDRTFHFVRSVKEKLLTAKRPFVLSFLGVGSRRSSAADTLETAKKISRIYLNIRKVLMVLRCNWLNGILC